MNELEVFTAALELTESAARSRFLDEACGGRLKLRTRIEALLQNVTEGSRYLESHAENMLQVAFDGLITERPGTQIGPYKLLEQIGTGGMGAVYVAEQKEPVRRKVALKVIKPGMDTRQVVARFEAERQALAMMNHPNIAKVLDAGATDAGRPYFVMELVKGAPITEFCDQQKLDTRERLQLFITVCHAVQHAHHKGLIHRDIKPSNVLVEVHDVTPVAKVIDFGVAKAIGQSLTEKTLHTGFGEMVGTPMYMSPEQAGQSSIDVDTRSDIYSLGVLLYEILTGHTPFERDTLREAGFDEMRRMIREVDPPRPSARVRTLAAKARSTVSECRQIDPRKFSQQLRGELDWIVMKALEKDRNRRYETANGFAADVQRYLNDESVLACPPSGWYRLRKFARRNKGPVLAATLVLLALVGGVIGTTIGLFQADEAHRESVKQRQLAEANEQKALAAAETAQTRESETRAVLAFVQDKIFAAARPEDQDGGLGAEVTLRKAVEAALPFVVTSFPDQPLIEARLRITLGKSFAYLGDAEIAAVQFEAARELYTQHRGGDDHATINSMHNLANSYAALGRRADALKLREETLTLMKAKLGPDHPDTLISMGNLANSYAHHGRHADALKLNEETLALMKAKLGPNHPDTLAIMGNLVNRYFDLGRYSDALKLNEETLALMKAKLGPDHPDTLKCMSSLAVSYAVGGRPAEALLLFEETLALQKAKLGPNHPDTLASMGNLAKSYADGGRPAEALLLFEETLALMNAKLGPDHPDTLMSMGDVAESLVNLDRSAEAVPIIDECVRRAAGKIIDPGLISGLLNLRLRHFEKIKDSAGCLETADKWEGLKRADTESLYNSACCRSVCAAVIRDTDATPAGHVKAKEQADQAMAWLKQAVAAGLNDAAPIKHDQDLAALRDREDFRKLLTELPEGPPDRGPRAVGGDL